MVLTGWSHSVLLADVKLSLPCGTCQWHDTAPSLEHSLSSALICQHPSNSAGVSYGTLTCKLDELGSDESTMLLAVHER